jgi:Ca2+-transporting ATPase
VHHAAGTSASIEDAILPTWLPATPSWWTAKWSATPTEGALLVMGHKAGLDIDATREKLPRLAHCHSTRPTS